MNITWLGQGGLLIVTQSATTVVDPYLLDTIYASGNVRGKRTVAPDTSFLYVRPDLLLITHNHSDHLDIPTVKQMLDTDRCVDVLCSSEAWSSLRSQIGGKHNYVEMTPGVEWSNCGVHIKAVTALHSEHSAIGFLIHAEGKTVYTTGDTLYSDKLICELNERVDIMFAVINGAGNNMNYIDAARMAEKIAPSTVVPIHWGLFESGFFKPELFVEEARRRNINVKIIEIYGDIKI